MDPGSDPTVGRWVSQVTSLSLSFLIYKVGTQNSIEIIQSLWGEVSGIDA